MYRVSQQLRLTFVKDSFVKSPIGKQVQRLLFCNIRHFSSTSKLNTLSDEHIVNCPYEEAFIPETDIYSHVFQHFPKYGKKTALIDGVTGREYSYNEVQESVVNMASGLVRSGMEKGDVLALVSPNSAEFCTTFFSTLAMGGIMSTCNPQYTAEELAYQFKNSNSKYVATIPALLPTIKEAASKSGCVEKIIVLSDEGGLGEGRNMIPYQSLVKDTGSRFPLNIEVSSKEDIGVLPYSSGTTGLAKGVMLTHNNIVANLIQAKHPQFLDFTSPDSCVLGVLPYFHIYGMVCILCMCLYQGTKLVVLPKFEPVAFLSCLQKYKVTDAFVVPPLALFLAKHPMVENYNVSTLRHMMSAAAPLDGEVSVQAKNRVGAKVLRQGYGLTELSPLCHLCPMDVADPYTIGVPILNTQVKIADVDSGEALGPHRQGEVAVKGPQVW